MGIAQGILDYGPSPHTSKRHGFAAIGIIERLNTEPFPVPAVALCYVVERKLPSSSRNIHSSAPTPFLVYLHRSPRIAGITDKINIIIRLSPRHVLTELENVKSSPRPALNILFSRLYDIRIKVQLVEILKDDRALWFEDVLLPGHGPTVLLGNELVGRVFGGNGAAQTLLGTC